MKTALIVLVLLVLSGLAFIRFAPADPSVWHVVPEDGADGLTRMPNGATWRADLAVPAQTVFDALMVVATATPRTKVLVAEPDQGRATFVTRSKLIGYPDYASVQVTATDEGARVAIFSRPRFGSNDWGVNGDKLAAWGDALTARLSAD